MTTPNTERHATDFDIEMFYDGDCVLCNREARMLRRLDRKQRIRFTDIAAPDFDEDAAGAPREELMARIHARLPDGRMIEGVEVFRRLYTAVGLGWIARLSRLPVVAPALDIAYTSFARNRLRLTGRCTDEACAVPQASSRGLVLEPEV